ncbi:MAG TPA: SAM-dependent methyltransferase, partial [Candidatus Brocadiia bacterium]|nr:SAM-dependent methyltransferase [Candidatus Brocadiia bacterium]
MRRVREWEVHVAGKVFLIGGGPGDPGLVTVRGLEALRRADAVVYDALAPAELLDETREGAELIDAGKRGGEGGADQAEISALLARLAGEGKVVARLKGGDPFVF